MPRWNHANFAVAPERMALVASCLEALFGWERFVDKPYLVGFLLQPDLHDAALYLRPVPAAGALADAMARLRAADPSLDAALTALDGIEADWCDHVGFALPTLAEWEARLDGAHRLGATHPEWNVRVVDVLRPGDGRSQTTDLHQAFIRVGCLGPFRNTFEMQARG